MVQLWGVEELGGEELLCWAAVEPLLLELYIQKAQMGKPLGIREGLCFANSIIEGTVHEEAMVYLKTRLKIRESDVSTLGSKY